MKDEKFFAAEYYPRIPREEIVKKSKYKISFDDLSSLGTQFSVVASTIAEAAMKMPKDEGLFRCVFPNGVNGKLASFKDGSGYLGTIIDENGFAAQARWIPVEGSSVPLGIDPVTLAVSMAVSVIVQKLDQIQETQEEILNFLHKDKESDLEGTINSLSDIMEQYHFNSDKELWKSGKLTVVTTIKGKAESNIIFYRKEITSALDKQRMFHGDKAADKLKTKLIHDFKYYQLCIYILAFASFQEVILGDNYSKEYLEYMAEKIRELSYQYRVDYTQCYEQLEEYMKGTVQSVALKSISHVSNAAGNAISNIPRIGEKAQNNKLIYAGGKINEFNQKRGNKAMEDFRNNRDTGIILFLNNIESINELCNNPVELYYDQENLYICS